MRRSIGRWALFAAGCTAEGVPSTEIATRDLTISVEGDDAGEGLALEVRASGPLGPVRFAGTDRLSLSLDGDPLSLAFDRDRTAWRSEPGARDGTLALDLRREDDHPVHATIEVPPRFELSAPPVVGSEPLRLSWTPAGGEHELLLTVEGDCVRTLSRPLSIDTGEYALSTADLHLLDDGPCPLAATLERRSTAGAPLVEGLDGGWFWGRVSQSRRIEVPWEP